MSLFIFRVHLRRTLRAPQALIRMLYDSKLIKVPKNKRTRICRVLSAHERIQRRPTADETNKRRQSLHRNRKSCAPIRFRVVCHAIKVQ